MFDPDEIGVVTKTVTLDNPWNAGRGSGFTSVTQMENDFNTRNKIIRARTVREDMRSTNTTKAVASTLQTLVHKIP